MISYLCLAGLVAFGVWIIWIRARGALGYWIRPLSRKEAWAVGIELNSDDPVEGDQARLAEVVALVRTLDRESGHVIRQWNREDKTRFLGLMLSKAPDETPTEPYELRHFPSAPVVRLSGRSNEDGGTPSGAVRKFMEEKGLKFDSARPCRLSGQSFSFYQWEILGESDEVFPVEGWSERLFQVRDIVLYPVMLTLFSMALIGTRNGGLFAVGLLLLIFLSGACKFVFVHQREDESQESHLQNY
ncbi:hypothetical protein [Haloferula sp.]|uniref:hypothetical protein n=1 Tax=Haloferula sp. TaxID=2497595 RepID=UPI00329C8823